MPTVCWRLSWWRWTLTAVPGLSRCLGLVGGAAWNRQELVSTPEWKRLLAERESRRWVETAEQAKPALAPAAMVTVVSDCEGDMVPLWARVPAAEEGRPAGTC